MNSYLGKKHPSTPVTAEDRVMSEKHLARRKEVEAMKPGVVALRKSIRYNEKHRDEHDKAAAKRRKELEKLQEDRADLVGKLTKARLPK